MTAGNLIELPSGAAEARVSDTVSKGSVAAGVTPGVIEDARHRTGSLIALSYGKQYRPGTLSGGHMSGTRKSGRRIWL